MSKKEGKIKSNMQINAKQLHALLLYAVTQNENLEKQGKRPIAYSIKGHAGIGKTSAAIQVAKELKRECVVINLGEYEEVGDLVGMPVKEHLIARKAVVQQGDKQAYHPTETVPGSDLWVPENMLPTYVSGGYKQMMRHRTGTAVPKWVSDLGQSGLLYLDDFTRSDQRFQQAIMRLILEGGYGSWKLPKGWTVLLSENPSEGDVAYNVQEIDIAQRTRFITIEMKFDIKVWAEWAVKDSIDDRCINFVLLHEDIVNRAMENFENHVNARSMTTFFNAINGLDFNKPDDLHTVRLIGEGSVGAELANNFVVDFINAGEHKMILPEEIVKKDWDYVKKTLEDLFHPEGRQKSSRIDRQAVVSFRLIHWCNKYAQDGGKVDDKMLERLAALMNEPGLLAKDLVTMFGTSVMSNSANEGKFLKLVTMTKSKMLS